MERSSLLVRPAMENIEEIFGEDSGDDRSLDVYDDMVTALAGSIYSELEKLISAYGQAAVTGLMPLLVSVLESMEAACAQAREREEQLDLVEEEKRQLLNQFERERQFRKRVEERCMEMEDSIEQERKGYKANLTAMESQTKNMEVKARNYADHIAILEEQKLTLGKELSALAQTHAKMVTSYKELKYQRAVSLEAGRQSAPTTPRDSEKKILAPVFLESPGLQEIGPGHCDPESSTNEKDAVKEMKVVLSNESSKSSDAEHVMAIDLNSPTLEEVKPQVDVAGKDEGATEPARTSEVDDIINSTPELELETNTLAFSTPKKQLKVDENEEKEEAQMAETDRNTDSLFAEVCGASPEYIGDMDEGADLQGVGNTLEALMSENTQLRDTQSAVDGARRNLIARVEELTGEREALKREVESLQQNLTRHEAKIREAEQDLIRTCEELEEVKKMNREDSEADVPAAQRKRFTRAEMARVLMERNQYKERLMELQDAVRRTEMLRVSTKDVQTAQMKKSSFWKIFSRLFNANESPEKMDSNTTAMRMVRSASSITYADSKGNGGRSSPSLTFHPRTSSHADGDVSLRQQKREHYRQIRSHIWSEHGRVQLHGWSQPSALACKRDGRDMEGDVRGAPMLVQLRLLDQKDPSTKLWCATGVCDVSPMRGTKESIQRAASLVWICSGTHSVSEVMVIDASRANHVLAQFVIPNAHVLCISSVPGYRQGSMDDAEMRNATTADQTPEGKSHERERGSLATVWLGTQEGSLYIHSAVSDWRECMQKVQLKDAIHCIVHTRHRVMAGLGDGTLAVFHRNADRLWDLENPRVVDLGRPQQSVRCAATVHNKVWCGFRNRIYVVDPQASKTEKWFEATSRPESQVRFMVAAQEGVWVSVRLDATLRLFHAHTGQPLQELELEPFVHRILGSNNLGFSFVQVSALATFCDRLWIGTTNGTIVSIPFSTEGTGHLQSETDPLEQVNNPTPTSACLPYCSMEYAQVCFHGHRDAVKFFASVPGCINPALAEASREDCNGRSLKTILVMSGGEGYINFRIGDDTGDSEEGFGDLLLVDPRQQRSERSHLIVWQVHS
ncbi:C-Jun-amino-terminal kinase-interacting protein 4-like [Ambystoma mexicanum]|uniref:C-Jun-amino-terminal kinase-interacting protein 4-like n=1 Tax=Ambystoma mexicanum TaxID=8296 RepID=UPI0037E990C6